MTFRGKFQNGVVVFRKRPRLREGAEVVVSSVVGPAGRKSAGAPKRPAFRPVGTWDGPPGELERLLGEVQQMREADLAAERAREHASIPT